MQPRTRPRRDQEERQRGTQKGRVPYRPVADFRHGVTGFEAGSFARFAGLRVRRLRGMVGPLDRSLTAAKHDRHNQVALANFENLLDAFCSLVALLSVITFDFQPAMLDTGYGASEGGWQRGTAAVQRQVDEMPSTGMFDPLSSGTSDTSDHSTGRS